jgi:hypothetical protein
VVKRRFKNGTEQHLVTVWVPETTIAQINALLAAGFALNRTAAVIAALELAFRQQFGSPPLTPETLEGVDECSC